MANWLNRSTAATCSVVSERPTNEAPANAHLSATPANGSRSTRSWRIATRPRRASLAMVPDWHPRTASSGSDNPSGLPDSIVSASRCLPPRDETEPASRLSRPWTVMAAIRTVLCADAPPRSARDISTRPSRSSARIAEDNVAGNSTERFAPASDDPSTLTPTG